MKKPFSTKLICYLSCLFSICLAGCGKNESSNLSLNRAGDSQSEVILISAPEHDAAEPSVAAAPDGSVYIVWVEHQSSKEADVFVRHLDVAQKSLGAPVRVNPEAGAATAWRGDPPTIKVGADGAIYVGWTASVKTSEGGGANDLYLSVSRDGGKTFASPVKVNDDAAPAVHGMHSLEIDKTGRIYFAWLDERYLKNETQPIPKPMPMNQPESNSGKMKHNHSEPNREVYFAVSTDGGNSFLPNRKIVANACPCCKTSIAIASNGRIYISWRQVLDGDLRHIAVSSSSDNGSNFSAPVIVSDDKWQLEACPVSGPAMQINSENTLKIFWFTAGSAGRPGLYEAESKDGGKTFSPRALVSEKSASGTPVIMQDEKDNSRLVFAAMDKSVYSLTAQNASVNFTQQNQISDAELPGAAISGNIISIVFIRKVNEKRSIFLLSRS